MFLLLTKKSRAPAKINKSFGIITSILPSLKNTFVTSYKEITDTIKLSKRGHF